MPTPDRQDDLRFADDTETLIFNHRSFCELIKHIMVQYAGLSYELASEKLNASFLAAPPVSKDQVEMLGHELEYHWAMLIAHGELYWTKGIASDFNEFEAEYLEWEAQTLRTHGLKAALEYHEHEKPFEGKA